MSYQIKLYSNLSSKKMSYQMFYNKGSYIQPIFNQNIDNIIGNNLVLSEDGLSHIIKNNYEGYNLEKESIFMKNDKTYIEILETNKILDFPKKYEMIPFDNYKKYIPENFYLENYQKFLLSDYFLINKI